MKRDLNISNVHEAHKNIADLQIFGDGDTFRLLCKASSTEQGFMKSTKICNLPNGCVMQVSTMQKNLDSSYSVAESITFIPDINLYTNKSTKEPCLESIESTRVCKTLGKDMDYE